MSNELTPAIFQSSDLDYRNIDAVNYSSFKHFLTSPQHYKDYIQNGEKETDAMRLGTAIHFAALFPFEFNNKYAVAPKVDKRTNVGKQTWAEFVEANADKQVIEQDDFNVCANISIALHKNQYFVKNYKSEGCLIEHAATANVFGLNIKGRIDLYNAYDNTIIDVKSIDKVPTLENCRAAIRNNLYYIQAYFYSAIIKKIYGKTPTFVFAFVEKKSPHSIGFVTPSPYWMSVAQNIVEKEFNRFSNCRLLDIWPSFSHSDGPEIVSPWEEHRLETTNLQHLID